MCLILTSQLRARGALARHARGVAKNSLYLFVTESQRRSLWSLPMSSSTVDYVLLTIPAETMRRSGGSLIQNGRHCLVLRQYEVTCNAVSMSSITCRGIVVGGYPLWWVSSWQILFYVQFARWRIVDVVYGVLLPVVWPDMNALRVCVFLIRYLRRCGDNLGLHIISDWFQLNIQIMQQILVKVMLL